MAEAKLRFYAELNDYLPPPLRGLEITVQFKSTAPVRHLIESQGVPHTEIEIILLNGASVDFEAAVNDADRISVYPMFESLDVTPLVRLRPEPMRDPRFLADAHLGRLARHLRLLGFDTVYENPIEDSHVVERAAAERRIILSRDRGLLMRRRVTHGCHIRDDDPMEQLLAVIRRCDLADLIRPFTRCLECNGKITAVHKDQVDSILEAETAASFDEFWRCDDCGRVYWKGSHYDRLVRRVADILERTRAAERDSGRRPR